MAQKKHRSATASRGGQRNTEVREHYHEHRVEVPQDEPGGKRKPKFYNPLLDDVDNPLNIRRWTHGTVEGYSQAGCTACERCAAAGRAEEARKQQARVDARLDEHRGKVKRPLMASLPDVPADVIADGAELIVSTHRVRYKARAILAYDHVPVTLALSNWSLGHGLGLSAGVIADLATDIIEELDPEGR